MGTEGTQWKTDIPEVSGDRPDCYCNCNVRNSYRGDSRWRVMATGKKRLRCQGRNLSSLSSSRQWFLSGCSWRQGSSGQHQATRNTGQHRRFTDGVSGTDDTCQCRVR